jgi:hypothetical protein
MAYDWNAPQESFEAGLRIHDRALRADTLRAALKQTGTAIQARKLLRKMNLPLADATELERIVAEL